MPGYESNLKKYCTGEELRYRLSMNDETLQEVLRASTQIVRTAGKGYQFLDTAAHDKLLETLLWMQSSEEYMDQEKKTFHLDKCVYGFQYEFELEFLVTEPMVATMLRAVCVQEDEMTGDCKSFLRDTAKVLRILARQIFDTAQATSVPLVDFLTKWTEQLPVDFLEMQLTRDHIKPPFFVIRDKVIRAELELLPDESRARLERLFALSPIWYQKDLEFLLQPVLPTGVKSAGKQQKSVVSCSTNKLLTAECSKESSIHDACVLRTAFGFAHGALGYSLFIAEEIIIKNENQNANNSLASEARQIRVYSQSEHRRRGGDVCIEVWDASRHSEELIPCHDETTSTSQCRWRISSCAGSFCISSGA
ncbi:unnamed protein product [Amoebophrya sp. A120]|nr:unnamed protein product [Amoebophrya sp. A120]|eukprot:GSA120T00015240001.1